MASLRTVDVFNLVGQPKQGCRMLAQLSMLGIIRALWKNRHVYFGCR